MNKSNTMPPQPLLELAKAATPGPWDSPQVKPLIFQNEEGQNFSSGDWNIYPSLGEAGPVAITGSGANAQLIARLNPAMAVRVYEALEWAREEFVSQCSYSDQCDTVRKLDAALRLLDGEITEEKS